MSDRTYLRQGATNVVTIGAASAQSTAFGPFTSYVRLSTPAVGVWYLVGANPVVTIANGSYLPPNWVDTIVVAPGEKVACIQPTAPAGTFNVTEMIG